MSDYGTPQNDQRNAITMALMNIAKPPGKGQLPQLPGRLPTNLSGGMSAVGNAIGTMGQPQSPTAMGQQPPGPPMSLAPPQGPQQPPPMPPPQPGAPPPQGAPVGAGGPMPQLPQGPQGPMPELPQGPQGLY